MVAIISTAKTSVLAADQLRASRTIILQNASGRDIFLGIGEWNVTELTVDTGLVLQDGSSQTLTGNDAAKPIAGIVAEGSAQLRVNVI